jgi:hypothetical protein
MSNSFQSVFGSGGGGGATLAANTFTGAQTISVNGAASTPPLALTGTIFTGGSATTTKPALLVEPAGTTSTGWSTSGTMIGVNAPSGFTGPLADFQVNGSRKAEITSDGRIRLSGDVFNDFSAPIVQVGSGRGLCTTGAAILNIAAGGVDVVNFKSNGQVAVSSGGRFGWTSTSAPATSDADTYLTRSAASVIGILGASAGASLEITEMTAPSAPASNKARIYAEDNGSGKTRLMALFPTGAAQQIAIEP